jgi:hypothetical protein
LPDEDAERVCALPRRPSRPSLSARLGPVRGCRFDASSRRRLARVRVGVRADADALEPQLGRPAPTVSHGLVRRVTPRRALLRRAPLPRRRRWLSRREQFPAEPWASGQAMAALRQVVCCGDRSEAVRGARDGASAWRAGTSSRPATSQRCPAPSAVARPHRRQHPRQCAAALRPYVGPPGGFISSDRAVRAAASARTRRKPLRTTTRRSPAARASASARVHAATRGVPEREAVVPVGQAQVGSLHPSWAVAPRPGVLECDTATTAGHECCGNGQSGTFCSTTECTPELAYAPMVCRTLELRAPGDPRGHVRPPTASRAGWAYAGRKRRRDSGARAAHSRLARGRMTSCRAMLAGRSAA